MGALKAYVKGLTKQPDKLMRNAILMTLPGFALIAYVTDAQIVLLATALLSPCLFALTNIGGATGQRRWKDPATGLNDEQTLVETLDRELAEGGTLRKTACVAISIDNFSEINRDWDKAACDFAIAQTAERLSSILRSGDELARLSKTTFGVMLCSIRAPETSAVLTLCERLEDAAAAPLQIDNGILNLTISCGFCIDARAPERTGSAMLQAAKAALQEAEQNAPRAIRSFSVKTQTPMINTQTHEVLDAMRDGQIKPWFQPQISTDTGEITGMEALARWDHPEKGPLLPSTFLSVLEASHHLEELGESILNDALRALVAWDKAGAIVPSVAVNFATQELRNPSLVERIKWDVDRFELDPHRLTVEVLETVISEHDDDIITRNIRALGSQGFRIDLDDFGTGHASLANIRRFAVDRIKIDRTFLANADTDPEQQRMIAAIIGLGERLDIDTLAEGVETLGEQSILSQLGCTHLQGFAIARPMPFEQTEDWILQHQRSLNMPPLLGGHKG
ncbi:MAG: bifunctional diguanylate cyclase/phosphodiesterase [Pseudomonadota bacterium]